MLSCYLREYGAYQLDPGEEEKYAAKTDTYRVSLLNIVQIPERNQQTEWRYMCPVNQLQGFSSHPSRCASPLCSTVVSRLHQQVRNFRNWISCFLQDLPKTGRNCKTTRTATVNLYTVARKTQKATSQ